MADHCKQKISYKKKRRGFCGTPSWSQAVSNVNNLGDDTINVDVPVISTEGQVATPLPTNPTISHKKVEQLDSVTPQKLNYITGYRMMDMEILSFIIGALICPECFLHFLSLRENHMKKTRNVFFFNHQL